MYLWHVAAMRTTVELPDEVFREMKSLAARQGRSMKEFVLKAIEKELSRLRRPARVRYSARLPLVRSKHPGALRSMTNAQIDDLLD